jgi:hypothetical protein
LFFKGNDGVTIQPNTSTTLIPSLMNLNIPKAQQKQNQQPTKLKPVIQQPNKSPTFETLFCQDIDERYIPPPQPAPLPVHVPLPKLVQAPLAVQKPMADIDERALQLKLQQQSTVQANTALLNNLLQTTNMVPSDLLSKLLNTKEKTEVVEALITTLTTTIPPPAITVKPEQVQPLPQPQPQQHAATGESSLNGYLQQLIGHQEASISVKAETEDVVEIDGRTNEQLPYILRPIDIEPSALWTTKPLINTSLSMEDQEFDPRIEFYSKIVNQKRISTQTEKQNAVNTNGASRQAVINDPRLVSKQNSDSDQQQQSLQQFINTAYQQNDLLQIHNRSNTNSLLSSLPDLQLPAKTQQASAATALPAMSSSLSNDYSNVVKLSIDDYKRKLQKPYPAARQNGHSNRSNVASASSPPYIHDNKQRQQQQQHQQQQPQQQQQQQLPKIPSYSIGLDLTDGLGGIKTPQSLHELLKNFPS